MGTNICFIVLALSKDVFNTTHFETILGAGVPPVQNKRADYPDRKVLEQTPQVAGLNLSWPMTNSVGFAVALNRLPIARLQEPKALQQAFEMVHKLLFSVAFHTVLQDSSPTLNQSRIGTLQDTLTGILMVRIISVIVEITFGIIILMTSALWYLSHRRNSLLQSDPATVADIMGMLQPNPKRLGGVKAAAAYNTEITDTAAITSRKFSLSTQILTAGRRAYLLPYTSKRISSLTPIYAMLSHNDDTDDGLVLHPMELRLSVGVIFISIITAAIGGIVFFEVWTSNHNGRLP